MDEIYSTFERAYQISEQIVVNLSMFALFFAMALITLSSVSRYLFNAPVQETRPVTVLYLLIMIVFLATPRLQSQGKNISVFFLHDRASEKNQIVFDIIGRLMGLIFISVLYYISLRESYEGYQINWYTTGAVEVPVYLSFGLMVLGLTFLYITLIMQFINDIKRVVSIL